MRPTPGALPTIDECRSQIKDLVREKISLPMYIEVKERMGLTAVHVRVKMTDGRRFALDKAIQPEMLETLFNVYIPDPLELIAFSAAKHRRPERTVWLTPLGRDLFSSMAHELLDFIKANHGATA